MTPAILMLILNIVFVIFIGIGFLQGLCGVKKSALKFTCFIVGIVLSAFLTPVISKSVMQIQISHNGQMLTLSNVVLDMINQSLNLKDVTAATPALAELFQNIPLMVGNLLVFIVLCYIMSFISWVIYKILALVCIKKDEYKIEQGKKVKVKTKKYRWWGGAIGVLQGFILMFVTFAPISGMIGLVNDLSTATVVVAEENVETELSPTALLINEKIVKEESSLPLYFKNGKLIPNLPLGLKYILNDSFNSDSLMNILINSSSNILLNILLVLAKLDKGNLIHL